MSSSYSNPWDPLGQAILDHFNGVDSGELIVQSDFEVPITMDVKKFFLEESKLPELDQAALSLCRGTVLDVGAGAGRHVLPLQKRGFRAIGMDISDKAVKVMRVRGVKEAVCGDFYSLDPQEIVGTGGVDTILMLMNGIGLVGNIVGLRKFLNRAKEFLNPDGRLVFDSVDLRDFCCDDEIREREKDGSREYFGEVTYRFNYKGETGPEFSWLYIDPDLLDKIADEAGWRIDTIYPHDSGHYLARMSLI